MIAAVRPTTVFFTRLMGLSSLERGSRSERTNSYRCGWSSSQST